MRVLRYVLLLATALIAFIGTRWKEWSGGFPDDLLWMDLLFFGTTCLNLIYLWFSRPSGRIGRQFSLWLDPKEAELRGRATTAALKIGPS